MTRQTEAFIAMTLIAIMELASIVWLLTVGPPR